MLTLYSYPALFGVADNNGYGLKVFAFLKLAGLPFHHVHIFDAAKAPRSQLPYIVDGNDTVGDSETILAYLTKKYALTLDAALTKAQSTQNLLITRMLDDLYWVMSYSRWKDPRYWPQFRDVLLKTHSNLTVAGMEDAQRYNFERYRYQGIGRYEPADVYKRGLADLQVLADLIGRNGFLFGSRPCSTDAGVHGFVANIHFYAIDTPLRDFVRTHHNLVHHCDAIHAVVTAG